MVVGPVALTLLTLASGTLAPGRTHTHTLTCRAGEHLEIRVRQQGSPVRAFVAGAGARPVEGFGDLYEGHGDITALFVAAADGPCRITVRAGTRAAPYAIRVAERRPATPRDHARIAAQARLAAARVLEARQEAEDYRRALLELEAARDAWRRAEDGLLEALALNELGVVAFRLGDKDGALAWYQEALSVARAVGSRRWEGVTLANLGELYGASGSAPEAFAHHGQALALLRAEGDRYGEAMTLSSLGFMHLTQGEFARGVESLEASLEVSRAIGALNLQAAALLNLGAHHRLLDETDEALACYQQSLALSHRHGDPRTIAVLLNNIGQLHRKLGQPELARDHYVKSLALVRALGDRRLEAYVLDSLAGAQAALGARRQALRQHRQALALSRAAGDRSGEAARLGSLGTLYAEMGDAARAGEHLRAALALRRENREPYFVAAVLRSLGDALREADPAAARQAYDEAIGLSHDLAVPSLEAAALHGRARLRRAAGELDGALADVEAALALTESLRARLGGDEARASYAATVHAAYGTAVDVLMALHRSRPGEGFDARALEASERGRARALREALEAARVDPRDGADPALAARVNTLRQHLKGLAARHFRQVRGGANAARVQALERDLRAAESEYEQARALLREASPRPERLAQTTRPLSVAQIQEQVLDGETLLLEYALGPERAYAWALTRDSLAAYDLGDSRRIASLARRVHQAWATPDSAPRNPRPRLTGELSRLLLAPLAGSRAPFRRLIVVADGALQYVPFAALAAPGAESLIARFEIVHAPSASLFPALAAPRPAAARTLAVLADPVFDTADRRVRAARPRANGLPRLPYTRREARTLAALAPPGEALLALDFDASRELATSPALAAYRVVHFATHALVDDDRPQRTGVVLSLVDRRGRDVPGFLRLHDVYSLELPAELVVLSTCRSAIGKDLPGEGLAGLSRGFMHAGARRVVASLWAVDEAATARLMELFYAGLLQEGRRPAEALRRAQRALAREPRWRSPYYWAGFVLQGDWR